MQPNIYWITKYILTIFSCILQVVSVEVTNTRTTELGKIIDNAIHCIYCVPAYYPHGWLWYALMIPIAWFSTPQVDMMIFAFIDMFLLILFINKNHIFIPFFLTSFISFFVIPQNIIVLWYLLLGFYSPKLLALAPLAKLPVGAPLSVWNFIFTQSLHVVTNYQDDYGVLVALWLYILIYDFRIPIRRGLFRLLLKSQKSLSS